LPHKPSNGEGAPETSRALANAVEQRERTEALKLFAWDHVLEEEITALFRTRLTRVSQAPKENRRAKLHQFDYLTHCFNWRN